jgi:putative Holliday junction resolvase
MRVLAVDYGPRRTGLAVSDETGLIARPLPALAGDGRERLVAALVAVVRELAPGTVLLGLPRRLGGGEGSLEPEIKALAVELEAALGLPVVLRDERLTTVEARERLREAGLKGKKMRDRLDSAAAAVILQEYLDEVRGRT